MRVLITRPRQDAEATAELLRRHGIESLVAPLMEIQILEGPDLPMAGVQALLLTSVNGARAMAHRTPVRDIPVFAVGDATSKAARSMGFEDVVSADGDVNSLAALAIHRLDPLAGELVHAAGTHLAGDLGGQLAAACYLYRREVLYEARTVSALPADAAEAVEKGAIDGVLLYSPRTAAIFAASIDEAGLGPRMASVTAFCLSAAVAGQIDALPWHDVVLADSPQQDALIEKLIAAA